MSDKVFCFRNEMTVASISALILDVNCHLIEDSNNQATLYFSSEGGYVDAYFLLLDFLTSNKSKILLVAMSDLYSAAACVYFMYEGRKKLLDSAVIMFHMFNIAVDTRDTLKLRGNLKRSLKDLDGLNKDLFNLLKRLNLPKKHLKRFKNGKDDFLFKGDWVKFLPKKQIDNT